MPRHLPGDPGPWTLISRTYLYQRPPWLTLRRDHLRLPSGREIPEYWISEFPPWGNVLAITPDDNIVLIRQYRPGIEGVYYEMPAGVVDNEDHDFEGGARRELLEETGYGGGRWSLLMTLSANPALTTNLTYTYLAEGVTPMRSAAPEETEDLRVHLVPVSELQAIIDAGDVIQALHAAPLLRYLLTRAAR